MSPQVRHALGQVGIMMVLAALGVLIQSQTDVLKVLGIPDIYWPIAGAVLASAVRYIEGLKDATRAATGDVVPADVGYHEVVAARQDSLYV